MGERGAPLVNVCQCINECVMKIINAAVWWELQTRTLNVLSGTPCTDSTTGHVTAGTLIMEVIMTALLLFHQFNDFNSSIRSRRASSVLAQLKRALVRLLVQFGLFGLVWTLMWFVCSVKLRTDWRSWFIGYYCVTTVSVTHCWVTLVLLIWPDDLFGDPLKRTCWLWHQRAAAHEQIKTAETSRD